MTNKEIYQKTLVFSLKRVVFEILGIVLFIGACFLGFFVFDATLELGILGLLIGVVVGIIILAIISHFVSYSLKAGQIAMMTKAITEGQLSENVYEEGKAIVKRRFTTVAAFYAVTRIIKGIFNQLGKGITAIGNAIGGDSGNAIGSAISAAIQILVGYLCDCCLGWVFYREEQGSVRATCEGAVLFFKHGKTLLKNVGRIFGMGLLSFLAICGVFTGIFFGIGMLIPAVFQGLAKEVAEAAARMDANVPEVLSDPTMLTLICAFVIGFIFWSVIHSVFVRPFILTGVLRNYIESGMNDIPSEASFAELDKVSPKFAKLRKEIA